MASFKNRSRDEIPSATLISHLSPLWTENKSLFGSENWCSAFAPNESYFAWSAGNSAVVLIPWSYCKSTLFCYPAFSSSAKSKFRIAIEKPDEVKHYLGCKATAILTHYLVRCMTFCTLKLKNEVQSSNPFWTKQSLSKDLFLATGHNNGHIRIWDILTGRLLLELLDHCDLVSQLSFKPNENMLLISSSYDGTLKIWDLLDDGNLLRTLKISDKPVYSCCCSPDGKSLISVGMSKLVYVWDLTTCTVKLQLKGHYHDVVACAFSPDSCLIATASWDTRVILWDAYTGKMLKSFNHQHPSPRLIYACGENGTWIRDVAFSSNGSHIATVADDGFLRFWDILDEENPESVAAVDGALCCSFSPSGSIAAVG